MNVVGLNVRCCLASLLFGALFFLPQFTLAESADSLFEEGKAFLGNFKTGHDSNDLVAADAKFQAAIVCDTNHCGAIIYGSMTRLALLCYDRQVNDMLTAFGVEETGRDLFNWTAAGIPGGTPTNCPTSQQGFDLAFAKLLPVINATLTDLNRIPTNWTGTVIVSTNEIPIDNNVEIDAGDVQMFQAGLEMFKGVITLMSGYNLDTALPFFKRIPEPTITSFLKAFPSFFTASDISAFPEARDSFERAIDHYIAGSELIRGETDSEDDDLIVIDPNDPGEAEARAWMAQVKMSLHGPVLVDTEGFYGRVDLSRLFASPYLTRAVLPKFYSNNEIISGTFPDSTFNGIIPEMSQTSLAKTLSGQPVLLNQPHADFVIDSIMLTPDGVASSSLSLTNTAPGQKLTAYVTVKNIGNKSDNGGSLGVYMDHPIDATPGTHAEKTTSVGTLYPGQSRTLKLTGLKVPMTMGTKVFRAFVNCTRKTLERDDGNNQLTQSYSVNPGYMDFVVQNIECSPKRPIPMINMTVYVTVKNLGTIPGNAGKVALWADKTEVTNAPVLGDKNVSVGILKPGEQKRVVCSGLRANPGLGTNTFLAFVDSLNVSGESDEGNNQMLKPYLVETNYVDFDIPTITMDPISPVSNVTFSAFVTVRNTGTVSGKAGALRFWVNGTNGLPSRSLDAGTLGAGAAKVFKLTGLKSLATGANMLCAAINQGVDANNPPEMVRSNNQYSLSYFVQDSYVDFVVNNIGLSPLSPSTGKLFTAYVDIQNIGTIPGNAGYLDVWVSTNGVGKSNASRSVGILKAKERKEFTFTTLKGPLVPDAYVFKAFVNSKSNTTETVGVGTNNILVLPYTVLP